MCLLLRVFTREIDTLVNTTEISVKEKLIGSRLSVKTNLIGLGLQEVLVMVKLSENTATGQPILRFRCVKVPS